MNIALAQLYSLPGEIMPNLEKHETFIKRAAKQGAHLIAFPELSLTGYAPTLSAALAFAPDDRRLDRLQHLSDTYDLTICVGLPLQSDRGTTISMGIFQANRDRQFYTKQYLHEDEVLYFVPGTQQRIITVAGHRVALAICYEVFVPQHAETALRNGADIYLGSVAKSAAGVARAQAHLPKVAQQYKVPVLMVNSIGPADNFVAIGHSAAWDRSGIQLKYLSDTEDLLLISLEI